MPKHYKLTKIIAILFCFSLVFDFGSVAKAKPRAKVDFTADTEVELSGLDTILYALTGSECDELTVSGFTLTVEIPAASSFTLGTSDHKVLKLAPVDADVALIFDSSHFTNGYVEQWEVSSSISENEVSFLVGVPQANTDYKVLANDARLGFFKSNSAGEVSFTYSGRFSSVVFEIVQQSPPTVLPVAPAPPPAPKAPEELETETQCLEAGYYWYNKACHKEKKVIPVEEITTKEQCEKEGYYWYDEACHEEKKVVKKPKPIEEMTVEELKAKIAEIKAQIEQLRAQLIQLIKKEITEIQAKIAELKA